MRDNRTGMLHRRMSFGLFLALTLVSACDKPGKDPRKPTGDSGYGPSEKDCGAWESVMAALAKQRESGALAPVPDFGAFLEKEAPTSKAVAAACQQVGMPRERFLTMSARIHKGLVLVQAAWAKIGDNEGDVGDRVTITVGDGDPGFDAWINNNWKRVRIFEEQLK